MIYDECFLFKTRLLGWQFSVSVEQVAEITEVCETAKIYALEDTKTNKGLRLRHGSQERVFRLEFISNRPFSDSEYSKWVENCSNHNVPLPTLDSLSKKEKDIKDLMNYQYTNDDIDTVSQLQNCPSYFSYFIK